jgi:glyoxylate/hydroxypyruvate reductase A
MALLIVSSSRGEEFAAYARTLDPALDVRVAPDVGKPEEIAYALAWQPPKGLLETLPNLRLIVSVGAGVDALLADPDLPDVPLVRFVDPDLTGRMTEYVALHVLYHHRRMSEFGELQRRKVWKYLAEPAAHEVRVGLMGLGVLGSAAARALGVFGYQVRGWSRSPKSLAGVACYAGPGELDAFLADTDILAVLLPLTPDTHGILDRRLLA